jgi:hypothetical protein
MVALAQIPADQGVIERIPGEAEAFEAALGSAPQARHIGQ